MDKEANKPRTFLMMILYSLLYKPVCGVYTYYMYIIMYVAIMCSNINIYNTIIIIIMTFGGIAP